MDIRCPNCGETRQERPDVPGHIEIECEECFLLMCYEGRSVTDDEIYRGLDLE